MEKKLRLAIVDRDKCKPKKCKKECMRKCPPQLQGKLCIEIESIAKINEGLCIGCGACVKMCPFGAIKIVNLPKETKSQLVFAYGPNMFRLYKFPFLQKGRVVGILGPNGIGKSTIMKILGGVYHPIFDVPEKHGSEETFTLKAYKSKDRKEVEKKVINHFKGSTMQKYFGDLYAGKLKVAIKHQSVSKFQEHLMISDNGKLSVKDYLERYIENKEKLDEKIESLELTKVLDNKMETLSGGEAQRIMNLEIICKEADVYIFDEPTNYLDVRQRLAVSWMIHDLITSSRYIMVIEHDISILDHTSDFLIIMYGKPGAYGISSMPMNRASAINNFFNGKLPTENIVFREPIDFRRRLDLAYDEDVEKENSKEQTYDGMEVDFPKFHLTIEPGNFYLLDGTVMLLGKNGTGKSTFLKKIIKDIKEKELPYKISYKSQNLSIKKIKGIDKSCPDEYPTVEHVLYRMIRKAMSSELFKSDVLGPLNITELMTKKFNYLSGGELQKVMVTICLGVNANIYLIDEPSANLDIEQRVTMTKVLRRFITHNRKCAFIVEHDMMMATALASDERARVVNFIEDFSEEKRLSVAKAPQNPLDGLNTFLQQMNVTFRKDKKTGRARINKKGSAIDQEQKKKNIYYAIE